MISLSGILSEVLDVSKAETYQLLTPGKKPTGDADMDPRVSKHAFSDGSTDFEYHWEFRNAKGNKMEITLSLQREAGGEKPLMTLSFGKTGGSGKKYHATTGAGDLKAILATVIKAADSIIANENLGGRNGLYAIAYSPADDRRDRIYTYFINTYFPNFQPKDVPGIVYKTFVNRSYGKGEIREIGETTAKPYPLTRKEQDFIDIANYGFKTDSGTEYVVRIQKEDSPSERGTVEYEVAFYTSVEGVRSPDYSREVNDPKNLYRVMATVVAAVKQEIAEDGKQRIPVSALQIEPSKRIIRQPGSSGAYKFDTSDMRRYKLYTAYIEKNMPPGSKVKSLPDGSVIRVTLPTEGE